MNAHRSCEPWIDDQRSWAPPRTGVLVERRDPLELAVHGMRAGLAAGLVLGLIEIAVSITLHGDPWLPFDFAAAILVGPEALAPTFPVSASVALGATIHVLLSVVFGVVFLAGLALTFQLSARPWVMLLYGAAFAVMVWEVNFLAVVPVIAPKLRGHLDLGIPGEFRDSLAIQHEPQAEGAATGDSYPFHCAPMNDSSPHERPRFVPRPFAPAQSSSPAPERIAGS